MSRPAWLAVLMLRSLLTLAAPACSAAAQTLELTHLPEPFGGAWISRPDRAWGTPPKGAVIVLPDAMGVDQRATAYVEALLRHGFVVLEIGMQDPPMDRATLAASVVVARQMLSGAHGVAPHHIGLLGFGQGGEVALGWAGVIPVAALYPRCATTLPPPRGPSDVHVPVLLLLPAQDRTDRPGACARLAENFGHGLYRLAYPDTTPGWDIPESGAIASPVLQPRDTESYMGGSAQARYVATARPGVTMDAARRVAWFMVAGIEADGAWIMPARDR